MAFLYMPSVAFSILVHCVVLSLPLSSISRNVPGYSHSDSMIKEGDFEYEKFFELQHGD